MGSGFEILKEWGIYAIAAIAGTVSFGTVFSWEDKWHRTILKFIAHLATSLFAALITYQMCISLGLSQGWTFVVTSLFAWQGTEGLKILSTKVNAWIGAKDIAK
jgi:hypothetical protein